MRYKHFKGFEVVYKIGKGRRETFYRVMVPGENDVAIQNYCDFIKERHRRSAPQKSLVSMTSIAFTIVVPDEK